MQLAEKQELITQIGAFVVKTIGEATAPLLARIAELEARQPQCGEKGEPGKDGSDGAQGEKGEKGNQGNDGIGLAGALIDRKGELVVTFTDGTAKNLGRVVGRNGKDGPAGKDGMNGHDGLGFDDMEVVYNNVRTFMLKFRRNDLVKEYVFDIPVMLYAGVFKDGSDYSVGDTVTYGGSLWHCDIATKEKPGEVSKHWTLIAKRGRDGKNGDAGPKGERGIPGPNGRDFTLAVGGR